MVTTILRLDVPPRPADAADALALARDGNSGGWEGCIDPDGSFVMENNGMFCANHISGYSRRTCADF